MPDKAESQARTSSLTYYEECASGHPLA